MEDYAYEARNDSGRLVSGVIAAESVEQASTLLGEQDLFVVRLASERGTPRRTATPHAGRATRAQVAWCMSQLSIMVEAGISFSEAIHCVTRQASDSQLRALLENISKKIDEGSSFSDALMMYPESFPPTLVALIRASEMNGSLSEVLQRCSTYLLNDLQTLRTVRGAMIYPIFMLVLSLGVTVFLLTFILPRFAMIFAGHGAALPAPTRVLMATSAHLVAYWFEWCMGIASAIAIITAWAYTNTGRRQRDRLMLILPLFSGILHGLYQCRTFRTIAVLLRAGVPVMDIVDIAKSITPNVHYRALWSDVEVQLHNGNPMSAPLLESSLISEPVAQMIEAGEKSGRLGHVFDRLADFIEAEYNQALKTAMQMIEPCMILFIGVMVGFIAASLMLPLFQASSISSG